MVYICHLCDEIETLSHRHHAMGLRHLENVREFEDRRAREQMRRVEVENESGMNLEPEIEGGDESDEEDTYNIQVDLDAIDVEARQDRVEPLIPLALNLDDEYGLGDFINAELEEILQHEDGVLNDGPADRDSHDDVPVD